MFNEGNQIHNFMSSSGSGTVINYGSGSGSEFLTSYGSGSASQKVTVPMVPVPQHCLRSLDLQVFQRHPYLGIELDSNLVESNAGGAGISADGKNNSVELVREVRPVIVLAFHLQRDEFVMTEGKLTQSLAHHSLIYLHSIYSTYNIL